MTLNRTFHGQTASRLEKDGFPHGGDWTGQEEIFGGQVLDFSANVSPLGLPASAREAVSASLENAHRYPDPECRKLRKAIAEKYGLKSGFILCGNGAADLIYRLVYAVKPKKALLLAPDFCEYERALLEVDCEITYREWMPGADGMNDDAPVRLRLPEELPEDLDILIFSNPNNPSGCLFEKDDLAALAGICKKNNTLLVIDECFMDFTENGNEHSLLKASQNNPHICILRAFTKFYGMAGLRLGWLALSDPELIDAMKRSGPPWSVSTPAQAAGIAVLSEEEYAVKLRRLISGERMKLLAQLRNMGLTVIFGKANYLLFYTEEKNLQRCLLGRGIAIRDCSNYRGLTAGWFRVAVRLAEENELLVGALREIYNNT